MIFTSVLVLTCVAWRQAVDVTQSGVIFEKTVPFGRKGYFPRYASNKIWFVYLKERLSSTETRGSLMVKLIAFVRLCYIKMCNYLHSIFLHQEAITHVNEKVERGHLWCATINKKRSYDSSKNIPCGVIYGHWSAQLDKFTVYYDVQVLEKQKTYISISINIVGVIW